MANASFLLASILAAPASPAPPPSPAPTDVQAPAPEAAPEAEAAAEGTPESEAAPEAEPDVAAEPENVEPEAEAVPEPVAAPEAAPAEPAYEDVPFDIGLFPAASINGNHREERIRNNVSLGLLWTRAARVEGIAMAGGITVVTESMEGVAAGQFGNLNRGAMEGVQASILFNTAEDLKGVQATHGYNWARTVRGAQFGLVNAAKTVHGVQFGLVNVADEADASLALIPVTRKGGFHPEVFTSDTALVNLGFRLPAKYTYMFASAGVQPLGRLKDGRLSTADGAGRAWEAGLGWGGHIPLSQRFSIDMDLGAFVVTDSLQWKGPVASMARARMLLNISFAERFTLWGGPTVVALVDQADRKVDRPGYGWVAGRYGNEDVRVRMWPGFAAGLRF